MCTVTQIVGGEHVLEVYVTPGPPTRRATSCDLTGACVCVRVRACVRVCARVCVCVYAHSSLPWLPVTRYIHTRTTSIQRYRHGEARVADDQRFPPPFFSLCGMVAATPFVVFRMVPVCPCAAAGGTQNEVVRRVWGCHGMCGQECG
jgi:hypothetical protein